MAIKAYPLNNTNYVAEDAMFYNCTRTTGVYCSDKDFILTPVIGVNGQVNLSEGIAWLNYERFKGIAVVQYLPKSINLPSPNSMLKRIDVVTIRYDIVGNSVGVVVKQGTPSSNPSIPPPERSDSAYEIGLYAISREPGESVQILDKDIMDLRLDRRYCGLMRDGVTGLPIGTIVTMPEVLRGTSDIVKGWSPYMVREAIKAFSATKEDLDALRVAMETDLDNLKKDLEGQIANSHGVKMFPQFPTLGEFAEIPENSVFVIYDDTEELEYKGLKRATAVYCKTSEFPPPPPHDKVFGNNTWQQISAVSDYIEQNNLNEDNIYRLFGWRVGDIKGNYHIIGFLHDDYIDSLGNHVVAGITFETVDIEYNGAMQYESDGDTYNWSDSNMKNVLLRNAYSNLPDDLKQCIKLAFKPYFFYQGGGSGMEEYLWPLSEREVYDANEISGVEEGLQYSFYTAQGPNGAIKTYGGAPKTWWLRSNGQSANSCVCVNEIGNAVRRTMDTQQGVVYGFCV